MTTPRCASTPARASATSPGARSAPEPSFLFSRNAAGVRERIPAHACGVAAKRDRPSHEATSRMLTKILAWGVHGYTALGLVAAGGMALAILDGQPASFRFAFLLMFVATLIDATDGTLARAIKIKQVLPHFDGRRLDDLIDFQTYTSLPLLLVWRAGLLPPDWQAALLAPLVASAYGFCQTSAKTDDGYFLGFPSYWNIIAFYLYLLHPPGWLTVAILWFFALMTFVPARYLYPTHR